MESFSYWVKIRTESALDPERVEEYRLAGQKLIELIKEEDNEDKTRQS